MSRPVYVPPTAKLLPRHVRVHPPAEVTTVAPDEAPPEAGGMTRGQVEAIWDSVVDYYKVGLQPGMGLCIRRHGQVVLDRAIGFSHGAGPEDPPGLPKRRATPDTLWNLFSATKSITAMLIHHLDDQGLLHLDDRVAEYIPEFARHGKGPVTLRHVLTHRAGIPVLPGRTLDLDLLADEAAVLEILCDAKPTSRAGRRLAYHAVSVGFVLAAVVKAVTGKDVRELLDEVVRTPLGFQHTTFGVAPEHVKDVAVHSYTGPNPAFPYGQLLERSLGLDIREAVRISNDPRFLTAIVPSGNVIGTAREVTRFWELLLREGGLDGVRVFRPRTVRRAVAEANQFELDTTMMLPVRYGMGFMLGGEFASFYGTRSPKAFGHLGFTNVLAWADPERDISVAFLNNGKPFITPELVAWMRIMWRISTLVPRERGKRWSASEGWHRAPTSSFGRR